MHVAFIDFVYHYDAARPEQDEPLGGTTSAVCFLSRELTKLGVTCSLFNRVKEPCTAHGVTAYPLPYLSDFAGRDDITAYVFCGRWSRELVQLVRAHTSAPLIAFMQESAFAPPFTPALDEFDGAVYVSDWQKRATAGEAKPKWRQAVIRNAMNPAVAASFPMGQGILAAKVKPPVLLYAGSFARGAFHIPPLLEKIRPLVPAFSVEVFCNTNPSNDAKQDAEYIAWMRSLPNIAHVGMVGQTELTARMKRASVFLSPNPWPETSCIALIEAMASGLQVVTTTRAALPETASGFARIVEMADSDHPARFNQSLDYDAFAQFVAEALKQREAKPAETEAALRAQVDFFHDHYQWSVRAAEWIAFLNGFTRA